MPGGSLQQGMLVECLGIGPGSGAGWLAFWFARQAMLQNQGYVFVADRWRRFYPPAAVHMGIEASKMVVVQPAPSCEMTAHEEIWAIDQALRCSGVSAVVAWMDRLDSRAFRRLQLAVEAGQSLGVLVRPLQAQTQPTWSDVQLQVTPTSGGTSESSANPSSIGNRRWQITLLRQRSRAGTSTLEGTSVELQFDEASMTLQRRGHLQEDETRSLHLAPRLARSANRRRSAGA